MRSRIAGFESDVAEEPTDRSGDIEAKSVRQCNTRVFGGLRLSRAKVTVAKNTKVFGARAGSVGLPSWRFRPGVTRSRR